MIEPDPMIGGLSRAIWEAAADAEAQMALKRELEEKIVYVSKKFNLAPECIHAILEEFGYDF